MSSISQLLVLMAVIAFLGGYQYLRGEDEKLEAGVNSDYQVFLSAALSYRQEFCSTTILPASMTGDELIADGVDLSGLNDPGDWMASFFPGLSITYSSSDSHKRGALLEIASSVQAGSVIIVPSRQRMIDNRYRHTFIGMQQQGQCI